MKRNLSKSKYMSGDQCEKRLWLEINDQDKATPMSDAEKRRLEQGTEVGILAREQFPRGVLISFDRFNITECIAETNKAMSEGASIIFEATFLFDGTYARTDIIERNKDGSWDIIEVKSATKVKEEYIPDLAIQKYVLEGSGLTINKTKLMRLNKECVYPDLSNLFIIEDLTDEVKDIIEEIPSNLENFKSVILEESEPRIVIGPHCKKPNPCQFIGYCWKEFGNKSIFDIPNIHITKRLDLREKGILTIDKIPQDYPLPSNQREYIDRMLNEEINIDESGIKERLSQLKYPIHFLDFETLNPAIPRFMGMHPYQQIPFQYSCYVLQKNGELEHYEYLHLDDTDPRLPLIESLIGSINRNGSVVAYHISFEKVRLRELADAFPDFSDDLISVVERLWDQEKIFNYNYKDFRFENSASLKSVLPVLVPELNYDDLAVREGAEAQVVWEQMIKAEDTAEKEKMIEDLKAYCGRDTLAMVEIHKHLLDQLSLD